MARDKAKQRAAHAAYRKKLYEERKYPLRALGVISRAAVTPPPEAVAERDRVAALPQTLSQSMFGDPLPGRSALDRMLAEGRK